MVLDLTSAAFWLAVGQIILIDIVLSGDNAVVIAMACRNLPVEQRRKGILWGVIGAVSLRVVLTVFAALVMGLPWLKLVGGLLLFWIAIKLMLPAMLGPEIEVLHVLLKQLWVNGVLNYLVDNGSVWPLLEFC